MTGYELAKTFDSSIGFFWKANHQQIYRELTKLRDRGHIQGREVVQSGVGMRHQRRQGAGVWQRRVCR